MDHGKIVAIIQARLGSNRLPEKVLRVLNGRTIIEQVLFQISFSKFLDEVVVATTVNSHDDQLYDFLTNLHVKVSRGSESDVLDRYYKCASEYKADIIVRITSDCPLIDPDIIDNVIERYLKMDCDYCTNTNPPTFPDGLDVEVFSFKVLSKAWEMAVLPAEREHVTPFIRNHPELFTLCNIENSINLEHHRWTIDREDDYEFLSRVVQFLKAKGLGQNSPFRLQDVLETVNEHPSLTKINDYIERNEGMKKNVLSTDIN